MSFPPQVQLCWRRAPSRETEGNLFIFFGMTNLRIKPTTSVSQGCGCYTTKPVRLHSNLARVCLCARMCGNVCVEILTTPKRLDSFFSFFASIPHWLQRSEFNVKNKYSKPHMLFMRFNTRIFPLLFASCPSTNLSISGKKPLKSTPTKTISNNIDKALSCGTSRLCFHKCDQSNWATLSPT